MGIAIAQVVLPYKTGLPEDVVVNRWAFDILNVDLDTGEAEAIANALTTFYGAIDPFLSNQLSAVAGAAEVRVYDLTPGSAGPTDDVLGSPDFVQSFTLTTAANGLPAEVAVCLSMNGVLTDVPEEDGATRPAARRRGRVYLGPLSSSVIDVDASGRALVTPGFITAALDAAEAMFDSLALEAPPIVPGVYSATQGTIFPVVRYSMDNAFDIIRGRGVTRTTVTERAVA